MKKLIYYISILTILWCCMSPQLYAQLCSSSGSLASGQVPNVGVNFGNISEVAYVNLFNQINMPFSAFGADGIVFDAATGATTNKANHNIVIGKDQSLHYPIVGVLKLSYKGTLSQANNFTATGGLTVVTSQANFPVNGYSYYELAVNINQVTTIGGEFTMQFHNVVSDIKLMRPGYELNENKIIIPQYESTFKGISVIRFKDYLNADNAFVYLGSGTCSTLAVINWADRSKPWLPIPAASIEGNINRGGSIESIVQICNQLNTDAWINIPVNASDNYITGLATYMKENLNPGRKVYYEVGNNIWSFAPGFCSNDQIDNKCGMYNFTCYPIWQVNRTKEITDIFASIWGWNEINQSVRALITGQTGNVSHLISKINYLKSSIGADQIGKYFYAATNTAYYYPDPFDVSSVNNIINNSYNNINNSLLSSTYLNNWSLQSYYERSLSEAGQYGLKNIVYEGGIDFGYSSGPTIAAAIRDPLMKTQIKYIMDKWFSRYGTDALFMFYKAKFDKTGYLTMGDMLDTYSGYVEGIKEVVNSPAPGLEISYRSTIPGIFDARNKERGFESAGEYPRIRPEAANDLQDSWVFSCLNAGRYNLAFEHKTGNPAGTTIDIYIDGVKVYDNLVLKATGEANNDIRMWSDVPHPALLPSTGTVPGTSIPLELSYGVHVMRIVCETPVNAFNLYDSFSQIKAERIIESTPTPSIVSGDLIVCESQPDGMLKVDYDPTVCNYKWFGLPPTASIAPNAGGPGTGLQKSGPNTNVIYVNWGNTPVGTYNMAVLAVNDLGTSTGRVFSVLVTSCGFTINPNQACTNSNISIQPNVSNATQYTWNFSTGANYSTYNTTSSGVLPIALVYTTPGSKTINLNVTLSGGLTKSFQRTLNINAPPVIGSISPNAISQCTVQDIVFSISGTGLYYQWLYSTDGGTNYSPYSGAAQAQVTFTGLTSTTLFKVQVANPGCSAITTTGTANAYVSSPIVSFSYGNNTYCAGMATPSGTFSGGSFSRLSGPGSIILNTMTGIISIVGSSAGIHTIRYFIPPVGSCPSISGISAITIAGGSSIFIVGSNSVCSGGNVILTASGANSYTWMPGNLSGAVQSVSPSGTTTYTVTGTTAQGCSAMAMTTVTVNSTPTLAINGTTSICTGGNTVLTASGANSYTWMPGNLSGAVQSVSPSATTTYTVTGTTAQGCSAMGMLTVTVTSTPAIAINGTTSICSGGNVILTASGANSYTWMPGNLSGAVQSVSPSGTTTYTVTGTTAQGCSAMGMRTVTVSSTPAIAINGTTSICTGGNTVLTASGANSYTWMPGNLSGAVQSVSPSATTTYTVTGTTAQGCSAMGMRTVTVSSTPAIAINGTTSICTGGNTVLTASGANSYTWMPGNLSGAVQSVSPSGTTTYTVTGTTAQGCSAMGMSTVTVSSTPAIAINGTTSICTGGNTVLTASGANSYTWMPGNLSGAVQSVSPSGTTTYTVTGTTAQGCSAMAMTTVTVNSTPAIAINGTTSICTGGNTVLTASGANSYTWMPGNLSGAIQSVSPSGTTTYTVTGTTAQGCSAMGMLTVTVSSTPAIAINGTTSICTGGNTVLTASGANSYTWMPGNLSGAVQSVSPSGTTTYTVTGTTAQGCSAMGMRTVTVTSTPTLAINGTTSICTGGNTVLTASGANSYTWMPGNLSGAVQSVSPSGTTTYTVTGTTAQGCSAMGMRTVTVSSTPTVLVDGTMHICTGASTVLTASGTSSFVWYPGSITGNVRMFSPTSTTTYTIVGSSGALCQNSQIFTISVSSAPTVNIAGTSNICTGGNTVLTASGANSYTWMPGNLSGAVQSVSPSGTTTYTVTGTTAQGCSAMGMSTVTVSSTPTLAINGATSICTGGNTVLTASGTSSFVWYPGSITGNVRMFSPTSTTTYTIVGSSGALCQNSQIFIISVSSAPTVNIAGTSNICTGGNTVLTASGANSYTWMPGNLSGAVQSVSPSGTTTYTVTGANNAGCLANTIFDVLVDSNSVSGNLSVTNSQLCFGNTINISLSGYYGVPNIYYNNMLISSQDMISAYVVTSNGVFYAVVKNGVCAEVTTSGVDVTIAPQVIKPIIQGVQTIVSGTIYTLYVNSITGETYQWTLSDNNTAVGINTSEITIAGFQVGVIKVSVFASNSCETDSSNIYLTVTNSTTPAPTVINSIANDNFVHIYPNPTSRYFTVECNECITPYLLNIYNSTGVKMLSKNVASNFENIYIDYSPGIYQIVINGKFYKLIIE